MSDRSVSVYLRANISGYSAAIAKAKLETRDFAIDARKSAAMHQTAWQNVGKGMLVTGAAIAAGIGLGVHAFMDFSAQMAQVKSLSGATALQMRQLESAAKTTGKAFGISATQAADAETELIKAGISVKDILGGGLQGALTLAADGQMDVAQATEIASAAMVQFGKSGKDIPHISDLLAAGADKALGSVGDLGQALTSSGTVAAQWGLTLEQTVGTLAEFAAAGQTGERGGTLLRQMLLQLTTAQGPAKALMDKYGFSVRTAGGGLADTSEIAGRLQASFGGLDKATRTHALGVIFGSHAIQGANILLKDGAQANADWAKKVDDSGFAAKQAAGKMDSLSGDVQKLKAAFQNDLIDAGSQANGTLRGLTQTATGLLNGFDDLPGSVQKTAVGLGAATSATLLMGGAATIILPKISAAQRALADMGRSGGLLSKGLGGTSRLMTGPWGLALAAGAIGLSYLAKKHEEAKEYVDGLTASLDQETGALTNATRAAVYQKLAASGTITTAKNLGLNLQTVTDAALGQSGAMTTLQGQLAALRMTYAAQEQAGTISVSQAFDQVTAVNQLSTAVLGQNKSVQQSQQAWKDQKAAGATASDGAESLAGALGGVSTSASDAATSVTAYKNALDALDQPTLDVRSSTRDWQASIDDAQKALKDNGRTLDVHTAKGRANAAALDAMATAARNRIEALKANGAGSKELRSALDKERSKLEDVAAKFDGGKAAAKRYVDQVLKVPPNVSTKIHVYGLKDAINDFVQLRQKAQGIGVGVYVNPPAHADGGKIGGHGGPRADDQLIRASTGEYMINAASAQRIGYSNLDRLNGYADGGMIGGTATTGAGYIGPADLSYIGQILGQSYSSKDDVAGAKHSRTLAINALKSAERALRVERNKHHPDAAKIHEDERRIEADRQRLSATTAKLTRVEASYAAGKKPLIQQYGSAIGKSNQISGRFIADLQKLAARGFGFLASQLLAQNDDNAHTIAAQAVHLTDRELTKMQKGLTTSAKNAAAEASLPAGLAISSALKTDKMPTLDQIAAESGVSTSDLQTWLINNASSLTGNKNAGALLAWLGGGLTPGTVVGGTGTSAGIIAPPARSSAGTTTTAAAASSTIVQNNTYHGITSPERAAGVAAHRLATALKR